LRGNKGLEEIPEAFLVNFTCLKVLDVSRTKIKTLPISLWQLTELEFLDLSYTEIEDLPEGIKNPSRLQFLDLSGCSKLRSLPCHIRELKNLKSLQASQYNVVL
jgi:Leucine-rich repeat (LRR) protein